MKEGIDYFPLDCQLDEKFELIEAEFGSLGFSVVVKLLQRIYGGHGYYCEYTDDVALLLSRSLLGGLACRGANNSLNEIVLASVKRGIFDKAMFDKYRILTSQGIQKRYFEAVRTRKEIIVKKEYLLINFDQKRKSNVTFEENHVINQKNYTISQQSKVKESIGKNKEHIVENDNNTSERAAPQIKEIIAYLNQRTGCHYKPGSALTQKCIIARLNEKFTIDDFKTVINKKVKEWNGTKMEQYIRPETLFGNKFESYLNQPENCTGATRTVFNNFSGRNNGIDDLERKLLG